MRQERIKPDGTRVEVRPTTYKTWIVCVNGNRIYESTNKTKAAGVFEHYSGLNS